MIGQHILETKQVSRARKAISLSPAGLINNSPEIEIQTFVLALIFFFFFVIQILSLPHYGWFF